MTEELEEVQLQGAKYTIRQTFRGATEPFQPDLPLLPQPPALLQKLIGNFLIFAGKIYGKF